MSITPTRLGTRGKPEQSRAAILKAAVREFAREGVAGARTDAIARSAGVNKALLYYYFKDKEALYQAVLDEVFIGARTAIENALSQNLRPRKRLVACARILITLRPIHYSLGSFMLSSCAWEKIRRGCSASPNNIFSRFSST